MMGYDPDEVTSFLRGIADEMEALIRERNDLRESMREKEMAIMEYKERDELLKNTITTATRMSDKIQADAEREARLIINDAQQKAEMIVRDSRDSLRKIFSDITELKKIRMQFENNVRAIVQSHVTMLDQSHRVMPNPDFQVNGVNFVEDHSGASAEALGTRGVIGQDGETSLEQRVRDRVQERVKRVAEPKI